MRRGAHCMCCSWKLFFDGKDESGLNDTHRKLWLEFGPPKCWRCGGKMVETWESDEVRT